MSCYTHKMAILTILVYCDHRFRDVTSPYAYDKSIREGCDADCHTVTVATCLSPYRTYQAIDYEVRCGQCIHRVK